MKAMQGSPLAIHSTPGRRKRSLSITCRMASAMSTRRLGTSRPPKDYAASNISSKKKPWHPGSTGMMTVINKSCDLLAWPYASGRGDRRQDFMNSSYNGKQLGHRIHPLATLRCHEEILSDRPDRLAPCRFFSRMLCASPNHMEDSRSQSTAAAGDRSGDR